MTESLFGLGGVCDDVRARTQHQASLDVFAGARRKAAAPAAGTGGDRGQAGRPDPRAGTARDRRESQHMQPFLQCYGYRLDSEGGLLCYAGDSGGVAESVIALARKADILIHMMHGSRDRAERAVRQASAHTDVAEVAKRAEVGAGADAFRAADRPAGHASG